MGIAKFSKQANCKETLLLHFETQNMYDIVPIDLWFAVINVVLRDGKETPYINMQTCPVFALAVEDLTVSCHEIGLSFNSPRLQVFFMIRPCWKFGDFFSCN